MINLLPPQQKAELLEDQKHKLFLISGVLVLVFFIALSLMIFTVKVYIYGKIQNEKNFVSSQYQNQEKDILEINQKIKNLESFYEKQPDFSELLAKIYQVIPDAIILNSIAINFASKDNHFQASLQGFSPRRDILIQLKKNLDSDPAFKDINFPPSNWVKPENIEFNFSFKAE